MSAVSMNFHDVTAITPGIIRKHKHGLGYWRIVTFATKDGGAISVIVHGDTVSGMSVVDAMEMETIVPDMARSNAAE